jgi:hypothetical protein
MNLNSSAVSLHQLEANTDATQNYALLDFYFLATHITLRHHLRGVALQLLHFT